MQTEAPPEAQTEAKAVLMPAKEPKIPHHMRQTAERSLNDSDEALKARVAAFKAAGEPEFERKAGELRLARYAGKKPAGAPEIGTLAPYDPGNKKLGISPRGRREDAYRFPETVDELRVEVGAAIPGVTRASDVAPKREQPREQSDPPVNNVHEQREQTAAEKRKAYRAEWMRNKRAKQEQGDGEQ